MTADLNFVEESLKRLRIVYRALPCKNGWFYYCKNTSNGISFDIKLTDDGTVRLWRFVGNAPIFKAGKRYPHAVVGVEITDEGDLCFFAELKIDPSDSEREICIPHMIESYLSVITNTSSAK